VLLCSIFSCWWHFAAVITDQPTTADVHPSPAPDSPVSATARAAPGRTAPGRAVPHHVSADVEQGMQELTVCIPVSLLLLVRTLCWYLTLLLVVTSYY